MTRALCRATLRDTTHSAVRAPLHGLVRVSARHTTRALVRGHIRDMMRVSLAGVLHVSTRTTSCATTRQRIRGLVRRVARDTLRAGLCGPMRAPVHDTSHKMVYEIVVEIRRVLRCENIVALLHRIVREAERETLR